MLTPTGDIVMFDLSPLGRLFRFRKWRFRSKNSPANKGSSETDPLTSSSSTRYTVYPAYKQKHNTPIINKSYDTSGCIPAHRRNDSQLTTPLSSRILDEFVKPSSNTHQVKSSQELQKNTWLSPSTHNRNRSNTSDESLSGRDKKTDSKFQTNLMKLIDPRSLMNFDEPKVEQCLLTRTVSDENIASRDVPMTATFSQQSEFNFQIEDGDLITANCLNSTDNSPIHSRKNSTQLSESPLTMETLQGQIQKQTEISDRERHARINVQRQLFELRKEHEKLQNEVSKVKVQRDLYKNDNTSLKRKVETLDIKLSQLGEWFFDHASDNH